jgi:hypothetical protein
MERITRIENSKEPSIGQMLRMARNLQEKHKVYCSITAEANVFSSGDERTEFDIYTQTRNHEYFKTWPEALAYYRKLMEEGGR